MIEVEKMVGITNLSDAANVVLSSILQRQMHEIDRLGECSGVEEPGETIRLDGVSLHDVKLVTAVDYIDLDVTNNNTQTKIYYVGYEDEKSASR